MNNNGLPYSSKFLWSNIFMIFVNYTEITKISLQQAPLSTGLDNLKSQNVILCYVISFTATGYKFKIYELATYIEGHRYMYI